MGDAIQGRRSEASPRARPARATVVAIWIALLLAIGGALGGLTWLQSEHGSTLVQGVAVFGYVVLISLGLVMTTASAARPRPRDDDLT